MQEIQNLYREFLNNFPENLQPIISIGLAVLLVYAIFKVIKKDFIFIIALVVLLPASVPILKACGREWLGLLSFIEYWVDSNCLHFEARLQADEVKCLHFEARRAKKCG